MRSPVRDCCPECLAPTEPFTWSEQRGEVAAGYICKICGHGWRCSWNALALGRDWMERMLIPEIERSGAR